MTKQSIKDIVSVGFVDQMNNCNITKDNRETNLNSSKDNTHISNNLQLDTNLTPDKQLDKLKTLNKNCLLVAHININFLYNKFEALKSLVQNKLDILVISETKIDNSYPTNQFLFEGFPPPFRMDRNCNGGGVMIYIKEGIPCKILKEDFKGEGIEAIFIELFINKVKWLLMGGYNPRKENISHFLCQTSKILDANICNYENIILLGDFNAVSTNKSLRGFCDTYNLKNLVRDPTYFKNILNPSSIDVILTNCKKSFQDTTTIETGLSDHHKMVVTTLLAKIQKKEPQVILYRSYKHFDEFSFRTSLRNSLNRLMNENSTYKDFKEIYMKVLNIHAPQKKKIVRGNSAPFMNKILSKAFMHRAKLKNRYNRDPTGENKNLFKRQRNYCVSLLRREKKKYYNNLDLRILSDNRKFWDKMKPFFTDKQKSLPNEIILIEADEVISDKKQVADKLNSFFVNAVDHLKIKPFVNENTPDTLTNDIEYIRQKYKNHPSVKKIKENVKLEGGIFLSKHYST